MKLLRIGDVDQEVPCVLDDAGLARDVSGLIEDFGPNTLGGDLLSTLQGVDLSTLDVVKMQGARIGSPISQPKNIYCIGLNYSDHAAEAGMAIPDEPILFNKSSGAFCGPNDPTPYTQQMTKLDWEVELGVVIGKTALHVSKADALNHIFGYTLVNDISERAWQLEHGGQWSKGKSFNNFCPTGPWLVSRDEIANPQTLGMWLDVNGTREQTGNTEKMVFSVREIISYLSTFIQLEPGDLICTGTPPGVGSGNTPPKFLKIGDKVHLGIDGLGEARQSVVKFTGA